MLQLQISTLQNPHSLSSGCKLPIPSWWTDEKPGQPSAKELTLVDSRHCCSYWSHQLQRSLLCRELTHICGWRGIPHSPFQLFTISVQLAANSPITNSGQTSPAHITSQSGDPTRSCLLACLLVCLLAQLSCVQLLLMQNWPRLCWSCKLPNSEICQPALRCSKCKHSANRQTFTPWGRRPMKAPPLLP